MLKLPVWPYLFILAKELRFFFFFLNCCSVEKHADLFDTMITSAIVLEALKLLPWLFISKFSYAVILESVKFFNNLMM